MSGFDTYEIIKQYIVTSYLYVKQAEILKGHVLWPHIHIKPKLFLNGFCNHLRHVYSTLDEHIGTFFKRYRDERQIIIITEKPHSLSRWENSTNDDRHHMRYSWCFDWCTIWSFYYDCWKYVKNKTYLLKFF